MKFSIQQTEGRARRGQLILAHGLVETPIFMPVGTQATVKGLTPQMVRDVGAQIILSNTYHLALRPGDEIIAEQGGLHRFMGWDRPILTDSGGYQVFSLADIRNINDQGVRFRSHIDGTILDLTPERAVKIQENLGSDIAMVLDECPPADASDQTRREAVRRSILWAERCRQAHTRTDQVQFAITQGGLDVGLRKECAAALVAMDFPGYALGGFSVGESPEAMHAVLPECADTLPMEKPRYLMGVGRPEDLLVGIASGIDMFDCVMPTRNGRNATAFTDRGMLHLRNAIHKRDSQPVESGCPCYCCANFSRAYLHHLFRSKEMLGPILLSLHNISYYLRLMEGARKALEQGRFAQFHQERLARWQSNT